MDKVHSMGIIHRDLKPENIPLDSNNNKKLCDFSHWAFINNETKSPTCMIGSLPFMSTELLQGRKDDDQKVDVYAFGVVVFNILTKGEYPDISFAEVANGNQAPIPSNISSFSSQLIQE